MLKLSTHRASWKYSIILTLLLGFAWTSAAQATTTLTGTLRYLDGTAYTLGAGDCSVVAYSTNYTQSDAIDELGNYSITWADDESELYTIGLLGDDCSADSNSLSNSHQIYLPPASSDTLDLYVDISDDRAVVRGQIVDDDGIAKAEQQISFYPKQSEHQSTGYNATTNSTGTFNVDIPAGIYNVYAGLGETMDYIRLEQEYAANSITDLGTLTSAVPDGDLNVVFMYNVATGPEYVTLNKYHAIAYNATNDLYEAKTKNSGTSGTTIATAEGASDSGAWTYFNLNKNETWTIDVIGLTTTGELVQGTITVPGSALTEEPYTGTDQVYTVDIVLNTLYSYDANDVYEFSFNAGEDQVLAVSNGTVTIPAYSLGNGGETVEVDVEPALDALGIEYPVTGFPYNFTAYDGNGATIEQFRRPIEIEMEYTEATLAILNIDENDIEPWYYNEESNNWRAVPVFTLDTTANTLTFETTHFSQYGLQINRATETDVEYTVKNKKRQLRLIPNKIKKVKVLEQDLSAESAKISWKHLGNSNVTAYQVRLYDGEGKKVLKTLSVDNKKIAGKKRASLTIKNLSDDTQLSADTPYQVQIRAYKDRKGNVGYGKWSKKFEFRTAVE